VAVTGQCSGEARSPATNLRSVRHSIVAEYFFCSPQVAFVVRQHVAQGWRNTVTGTNTTARITHQWHDSPALERAGHVNGGGEHVHIGRLPLPPERDVQGRLEPLMAAGVALDARVHASFATSASPLASLR